MTWRDNYRQASFRGVEFFVESHDAQFGRRQQTHEYPQRDEPFTEDLGRAADRFTVSGYLLGEDYNIARDRLIAECRDKETLGELVHPYLGSKDVYCLGLRVSESSQQTAICGIELTFVEAGLAQYPSNGNDAVKAVTSKATAALAAARGGFSGLFKTAGFPSFVGEIATLDVQGFASFLLNLTINPTGDVQDVAAFSSALTALHGGALSMISNPAGLAGSIGSIITSMSDVFGARTETALRALRAAYPLAPAMIGPTPSQVQRLANTAVLAALVRRAALTEEARAAVIRAEEGSTASASAGETSGSNTIILGYQTRDEAIADRDEIIDALDIELEDPATTTEEFQALSALRVEVVRGVPSPTLSLPRVATFTPRVSLPSLIVAYGLYEDAGRAQEIAERNRASHPGFLPGGLPLQIITDA